ncbi:MULTISPECIES: YdcF family protein [unclassified Corynebacterium]|uniref:YdcF family protein n=1 Tax=Corynebacterium TaxID=1716 RepID=UPI00254BD0E6|nr:MULTISPECIES: YdcF family protein [unclassified Corynebacterium]MDK8452323.1 YdcF family protein [Corynebacterium sp. MSK084]MDK8476085.1 YdcF family protein [Corynebacterium sp. MSK310]MDK8490942.1 YdcF family protein [Corynebacterium sp. MSK175]MDK8514382.1 YdcF family protein [Corynebacterium sp. MSK123]MDK8547508.1 YdcF family protein [Corynebacterium sp. MSK222]
MKYVVVLGTAQYDGRPSRILAGRLRHAGELAISRGLPVITVGGQLPGDRFTEAGVARDYLREHFPELQVSAVEKGLDTRESLAAVIDAHGLADAIIVTDSLHRLRTWVIAKQEGLDASVSGTPYYPARRFSKPWWRYLAHECGGLFYIGLASIVSPRCARAWKRRLYRIELMLRPNQKLRHETMQNKDADRTLGE